MNGRFITGKAVCVQSDSDGKWFTLHNQLYFDNNNELIFVPRYFVTDGYTIPEWIAWLGGGKMKWDIRPAIGHDFECKYHAYIKVNSNITELREKGLIKTIIKERKLITICENIPVEYLEIVKTTFNQTNSRFKRMMKSVNCIKSWRLNMMRLGVNFNFGWMFPNPIFNLDKIYKEKI